jgi:hypothetical protein
VPDLAARLFQGLDHSADLHPNAQDAAHKQCRLTGLWTSCSPAAPTHGTRLCASFWRAWHDLNRDSAHASSGLWSRVSSRWSLRRLLAEGSSWKASEPRSSRFRSASNPTTRALARSAGRHRIQVPKSSLHLNSPARPRQRSSWYTRTEPRLCPHPPHAQHHPTGRSRPARRLLGETGRIAETTPYDPAQLGWCQRVRGLGGTSRSRCGPRVSW